jgi:secreted trypsin-like serine protease
MCILLILAAGAGKLSIAITPSIMGGSAAALGQFPWQVLLSVDDASVCGGSLILPNWVLTASHCIG